MRRRLVHRAESQKAEYSTADPVAELGINPARIMLVPMTTLLKSTLADSGLDQKGMMKCKNMLALGIICWLFDRPVEGVLKNFRQNSPRSRQYTKLTQRL